MLTRKPGFTINNIEFQNFRTAQVEYDDNGSHYDLGLYYMVDKNKLYNKSNINFGHIFLSLSHVKVT